MVRAPRPFRRLSHDRDLVTISSGPSLTLKLRNVRLVATSNEPTRRVVGTTQLLTSARASCTDIDLRDSGL